MDVADGLAGVGAAVADEAVAAPGYPLFPCNLFSDEVNPADKAGIHFLEIVQ